MSLSSNAVSVVAGGWSVTQVSKAAIPGRIVAVNDSAKYLPRVDEIVSMDRLWTEARWDMLVEKKLPTFIRYPALMNVDHWSIGPWLHRVDCDYLTVKFSETPDALNGTNSGVMALNRAYQLKPEILFLFGLDMQPGPKGEPHWHPPYEWKKGGGSDRGKMKTWAAEFRQIAAQFDGAGIRVINVNTRSLISDFEIIDPSKFVSLVN